MKPRRVEFDGTHQERALRGLLSWSQRALRTKSGKTLKDLAEELAISPATLARYLNGTTPLGSHQFAPFARAFETTEAELVAACFPSVAEPTLMDAAPASEPEPAWDFRAELERVYGERLDVVEQAMRDFGDMDTETQRLVIEVAEMSVGLRPLPPDEIEDDVPSAPPRSRRPQAS